MKKEVFDKLASTGRYLNTGKVLIGLRCTPKQRYMTRDEERLQAALLRAPIATTNPVPPKTEES